MADTHRTNANLLLVDHDRLILMALEGDLRAEGFDVLVASSAEAALKLARAASPDLACCDLRMPRMAGPQLARQLREETPVPFIFLSAYADEEGARLVTEHGALGVLTRPIDVTTMLPAIREAPARAARIRNAST